MKKVIGFLVAALLVLQTGTALAHDAMAVPPGPPPQAPKVEGQTVSLGRFVPGAITVLHNVMYPGVKYIHEGETVTFVNATPAPHTVTFQGGRDPKTLTEKDLFAPTAASGAAYEGGFFSSGMMEAANVFAIKFTKVGVYDFFCVVHPEMTGTIVVLPAGTVLPSDKEQAAAADAHQHHRDAVGEAADKAAQQSPARVKNADGTTTWTVNMGASVDGADLMKFYPSVLQIREGDSVIFHLNSHSEAHSASVNRPKDVFLFGNGPMGLNPAILAPAGDRIIDGAAQFDGTGLVLPGMPDGKLTFTKAGTYHIHCDLHDMMGMTMAVQVVAKDAIAININGKRVEGAQVRDGVVYAPVRAMGEALGGTVSWDAATGIASVTVGHQHDMAGHDHGCTSNCADGHQHGCTGDCKVQINGMGIGSSYAVNGRMYVPASAWVELLGGTSSYDADAGLMILNVSLCDTGC